VLQIIEAVRGGAAPRACECGAQRAARDRKRVARAQRRVASRSRVDIATPTVTITVERRHEATATSLFTFTPTAISRRHHSHAVSPPFATPRRCHHSDNTSPFSSRSRTISHTYVTNNIINTSHCLLLPCLRHYAATAAAQVTPPCTYSVAAAPATTLPVTLPYHASHC